MSRPRCCQQVDLAAPSPSPGPPGDRPPLRHAPPPLGKVRDLYEIEEGPHAGQLLMVASDRISAFDHILSPAIPDKGEILTRMSLWWFDQLADLVPHHVCRPTSLTRSAGGR